MNKGGLIIRADAGPSIGIGHVMRCLALAEVWRKAGQDVFLLSTALPPSLQQWLRALGVEWMEMSEPPGSRADAAALFRLATQSEASWAVIDGYHLGHTYEDWAKTGGVPICRISDYGLGAHAGEVAGADEKRARAVADLVVDQNLGSDPSLYPDRGIRQQLLQGPRYALLRQEFRQASTRQIAPVGRHLLVTLGGADPAQGTLKVLEALRLLHGVDVQATVITGPSNPRRADLEKYAQEYQLPVRFEDAVINMSRWMAEADIAVAAAGSTVWELCCTGLPSVLLIAADNQKQNAAELARRGAALDAGEIRLCDAGVLAEQIKSLLVDEPRRRRMSICGRELVDGRGSFRVWRQMNDRYLQFRDVQLSDSHQVWTWANAPETRRGSFSTAPIPWLSHELWFRARLEMPGSFWLATTMDGLPLGQVRFDFPVDEQSAVISASMDPARLGQGWGSLLMWSACCKLFRETKAERIEAHIKTDNVVSQRSVKKAGFYWQGEETIKGQTAFVYERKRADD